MVLCMLCTVTRVWYLCSCAGDYELCLVSVLLCRYWRNTTTTATTPSTERNWRPPWKTWALLHLFTIFTEPKRIRLVILTAKSLGKAIAIQMNIFQGMVTIKSTLYSWWVWARTWDSTGRQVWRERRREGVGTQVSEIAPPTAVNRGANQSGSTGWTGI